MEKIKSLIIGFLFLGLGLYFASISYTLSLKEVSTQVTPGPIREITYTQNTGAALGSLGFAIIASVCLGLSGISLMKINLNKARDIK